MPSQSAGLHFDSRGYLSALSLDAGNARGHLELGSLPTGVMHMSTREEALAKLKKLRSAFADADKEVRELIYGESDSSQRPHEEFLAKLDKAIADLESEP
jgi:hypothetical protein